MLRSVRITMTSAELVHMKDNSYLKKSINQFIEALPMPAVLTDATGQLLEVNSRWADGIGLDAHSGPFWLHSRLKADSAALLGESWEQVLSTRKAAHCPIKLLLKSNEYQWFTATISDCWVENAPVYVWTFTDFDQQKRLECSMKTIIQLTHVFSESSDFEESAPSLARALSKLQFSAIAVWLVNEEAKEFRRLCSWVDSEKYVLADLERLPTATENIVNRCLQARQTQYEPSETIHRASSTLQIDSEEPFGALAFPVKNRGRVVGIIEVLIDNWAHWQTMTATLGMIGQQLGEFYQRCEGANQLDENVAQMRTMIGKATTGIFTLSDDGLMSLANPAFQKMCGYSLEEIIGQPAQRFFRLDAQADSHDSSENLEEILCTKDTAVLELQLLRKDGNCLPVEFVLTYMRVKNKSFRTGSIRDITRRKEAEQRVSEFYSIVSHELRSPLTSIRGALGLLENGIAGNVDKEGLELITISRSNSDRLLRLIGDILDAGKVDSGKFELQCTPCSVESLIHEVASGLQYYDLENDIKIRPKIEWSGEVFADRDRLIQVLTNLVSNAIKFSPKGASVDLIVALNKEEDTIRFTIRDYGPGIPQEMLSKLFERFRQLHASDSGSKPGTGLGLYISKAIVEKHGGTIRCLSDASLGSRFWFDIPRRAPGCENGEQTSP